VERVPDEKALGLLRRGVMIEERKTRPAEAVLIEGEPDLPPRPVPIRFRKNIPAAWIALTVTEGRNRQVRKMTAAVGHPALRLVRVRIGSLGLGTLKPGEKRVLDDAEVGALLGAAPVPGSVPPPARRRREAP
jgi:23S rRNA pseudouridine2457 synthase